MEKTVNELIDFTVKSCDLDLLIKIEPQQDVLDHRSYNATYGLFEETLNRLYEKVRALEQINRHSHLLINQKINQGREEVETLEKKITELGDQFTNKDYRVIPIDIRYPFGVDKFNEERLPLCEVRGGRLVMGSFETAPAHIIRAEKTSTAQHYRDTLSAYPGTGQYRTYYILD